MALRELLAFFKINVDTHELTDADGKIRRTASSTRGLFDTLGTVRNAFLVLGAAAAAQQMARFADSVLDAAGAERTFAKQANVSFGEFQAITTMAGRMGQGAQDVKELLSDIADRVEDFAERGQGEGVDAFEKLGFAAYAASGKLKTPDVLLKELAIGLTELPDQTQAAALGVRVFGDEGIRLVATLGDSREAIEENFKRARQLGVIFDKELAKKSTEVNLQMSIFHRQLLGLKATIVRVFIPTLQQTTGRLVKVANVTNAWAKTHRDTLMRALQSGGLATFLAGLAEGIESFGGVQGAIKFLMPWVKRLFTAFARFIIPFLAFDDFLAFLDGRKSVIGEVLEEFGLVDDAVKSGKDLKKTIKSWIPALKEAGKQVSTFYTETAVSFGALVNMFTTGNEDMRSDYESTFLKNGSTIDAFGDTWANVLSWMTAAWTTVVGGIVAAWTATVVQILEGAQEAATNFGALLASMLGSLIAALSQFAGFVDSVFGTSLKDSVDGATANIVEGFQGAWAKAVGGIETIENAVRRAGAAIKGLITDPIGEAARIITGGTNEGHRQDIEAFNAAQIEAVKQRSFGPRASIVARTEQQQFGPRASLVLNDQRTTTVQVSSDQPGPVGREVGKQVNYYQDVDRSRTLAAFE